MTDGIDRVACRRQVQVGEYNGKAQIIAAVPDGYQDDGAPHYVVTAVIYGRADQPPREYVTWAVRADQPGYYWGRYFQVNDGADPAEVRRQALTDMVRRAGLITDKEN